ncbi:MAG: RHS repeat-associated core domain-containing protein [Nitrospirae bacterium]|nr:RHS repeat-associated core domain-containing protein [Nitrospirota bacterium]
MGQTTTFTYDALNRVTLKQLADGTSVTYLYDTAPNGIGRLASVTDSSGGTSFQYDIMGRVTQSTKTVTSDPNAAQFPSGYTTLTQYDTLGRITTLTYPSPTAPAPQVTYSYNAAGGLYQITEGSTIYATYPADQYTALGQPKSVTYGNGVTTNYTYRSDNNRLQQIVTQLGTNPAYQDLAYTFDPVGNITRVLATTSAFGTEDRAFAYDGLHRLTQATYRPITPAGSATTYAYGYDTIGNLTNKSQGASTRKEETDVAITYQNPAAPPVTVENTSPAISYEKRIVNWSTQSQGNASGGSYAYSNAVGDTASVVFTGTGVQWISAKSKDSGIAQVYLDGVLQGSVDLYQQGGTLGQNNASYQQVVWSATGLTNTTHLVDVIVTGTKNSSSSNTYIAVDAFVVGTTTLQESSPAVTLTAHLDNTWTTKTNSAASGGSYAATDNQDAVVSYRFAGTGIQWLSVTSSDGKPIDVYLDGVYQATVNLYGATQYQQVVWSRTGLTSGLHLFKLARTPSQGGGGGGGCGGGGTCDQFTLDAVKVQATPDSAWVLTENSALTLDYGKLNSNNTGWSKQNDSAASGGSYQRASTSCGQCSADGMEATYSFSGYGIVWIARKDSVAGKADVWLDGVFQTTIDLYNATTLSQQQVWSRTDLSNGSHTLTIVVTGTKNASSGGTNVYLDALWVYNALGWHAVSDASASGGQTYATDQATATATVTFTGTGVSWLAPVGPTGGSATVVLDGNTLESVTVNLNHPLVRAQQIVYSKSGLTNGPHQLVITTTSSGTINSPVGGLIDALDVVGALTEQVACAYTNTAHVHAVSGCGGEQFAYGLTGNLTAYDHPTDNTKDQSYGWDVQNRLLSSTVNSVTTTFIYDGDGGRVKKIVSGAATVYIGQLYECTQTGGCTRYIFAGDDRIALRTSAGDFKYYHTDHLGSSTIITKGGDPNNPNDPDRGALDQAITYAPYGAIRTNSLDPASGVHHKFTGQERDDSTGLDFYSARYYASAMHRFISPDSIVPNFADPQSLNRYSYVRNNPILYTDPSGHIFGIDDVLTLGLSNLILAGAAVSMATAAATGATSHDELRQAAIAGGVSGPITIPASLFSLTLGCVPCAIAINTLAGAAGGAASSAAIGVDPGIGAAAGAVSGFVSSSVGAAVGPAGLGWNIYAAGLAQVGAAAATGGATSAALGGDFWQGAAQGAVGSAIVWGVTSSPQIVADFKSLLAWFASPSTAPPTVPSAALAPSYDPGRLAPGTTVTPVMGPAIRLGVWLVERALGARIGTLTIEDLVASGRVIEATKTLIQIDRSGGPAAANRAFDALAKGRQITNYGNGIRSVELPGGGSASVRPFSSAPSRPTIQIDQPTGPTIKIRF